ncbi:MAG TPA: hypothetical protein VK926_06940 [Gaiellaceae bacterium]|nr:hypothetical protein [Gaiellaceae bacterium]
MDICKIGVTLRDDGTQDVAPQDHRSRSGLDPDDPISALRGIFAGPSDVLAADAVRAAREEDIEIEEEKWRRLSRR